VKIVLTTRHFSFQLQWPNILMKKNTLLIIFSGCYLWGSIPLICSDLSVIIDKSRRETSQFENSSRISLPFSETRPHSGVLFHRKPKPLPSGAVTHNWTSFLGPTHNAVSSETKLLKAWPTSGPQLVWELTTGTGYASPAIQGGQLVHFYRQGNQEVVDCVNTETGKRYWKFRYQTQYRDRYGYNNGPRSSPVIDGDRVYTYGAEGKLYCLKLKTGKVDWMRHLSKEFHVSQEFFGVASTPLVEGNLLIVNVGAPGGPEVVALNKLTGKLVWGAGDQWGPSYASPISGVVRGRKRVFVLAGGESRPPTGGLLSIDLSDGKIDFRFPWRSRSYSSVNASCPVIIGNQVFISASYKTGAALLNILPDGSHSLAWTAPHFGLHWNTPVHKDGYLYGFDGRNEPDASLVCLDLKTGKEMWRTVLEWEEILTIREKQVKRTFSTYRGSLLWADGHFLCLGELGNLLWLDLSPQGHRTLSRTRLFAARESWSPLVLSRGLLYVSQNRKDFLLGVPPRLLCYDLRANSSISPKKP